MCLAGDYRNLARRHLRTLELLFYCSSFSNRIVDCECFHHTLKGKSRLGKNLDLFAVFDVLRPRKANCRVTKGNYRSREFSREHNCFFQGRKRAVGELIWKYSVKDCNDHIRIDRWNFSRFPERDETLGKGHSSLLWLLEPNLGHTFNRAKSTSQKGETSTKTSL